MRHIFVVFWIALVFSLNACTPVHESVSGPKEGEAENNPGPDRRFLMAFTEVSRILTGKEAPATDSIFRDGKWLIRQGDTTIGSIDDEAPYSDEMDLLIDWARSVVQRDGIQVVHSRIQPYADRALAGFSPEYLMVAMQRVAPMQYPVSLDAESTCLLARASSLVYFQLCDDVQVADIIPAKALAAVALSKICGKDLPSEEALLVYTLDYRSEALDMARLLAPDDPVACLILGNDAELLRFISRNKSSIEACYFYLYRLAELHQANEWFAWERSHFTEKQGHSLPIICLAYRVTARTELARKLVDATLDEMESLNTAAASTRSGPGSLLNRFLDIGNQAFQLQRPDALDSPSILNRFESFLAEIPTSATVNVFDPIFTAAFYRAYFYSALFDYAKPFMIDPTTESARDFVQELGDSSNSTAGQFYKFYADMIGSTNGSDIPALLHDLNSTSSFGEPVLISMFKCISRASADDPSILRQARFELCRRLDSRPGNRHAFPIVRHGAS